MVVCYLGIGSNLGNRRRNIRLALQKINQLRETKVLKVSKIIETEPVGGPAGQSKFLNAAIKINTALSPSILLKKFKKIEMELGRTKTKTNRFGPRSIDLDILFYADKIINTQNLKVPHPKCFKRQFVLRPLLEII